MLSQNPELASSLDASGLSAVLTAVYYGQQSIVDRLIASGAPLNLFEAAATGRLTEVKALLDKTPSQVNAWATDGFQPLGLACFFGHVPLVELMLNRGADVNSPSRNPLKVQPLNSAVAGLHLEIARLLLEHHADPNARQGEGFTPLHAAAENGQISMIQLLLSYGADPHLSSTGGKTPYDVAIEAGHAEAAQLLA
jgi:ankyrin repeat protein